MRSAGFAPSTDASRAGSATCPTEMVAMEINDEDLKAAVDAAVNDDVARTIFDATAGSMESELLERVSPSVLFTVDEAFGFPGTQNDRMRQVHDATVDAIHDAVERAAQSDESSPHDGQVEQ